MLPSQLPKLLPQLGERVRASPYTVSWSLPAEKELGLPYIRFHGVYQPCDDHGIIRFSPL